MDSVKSEKMQQLLDKFSETYDRLMNGFKNVNNISIRSNNSVGGGGGGGGQNISCNDTGQQSSSLSVLDVFDILIKSRLITVQQRMYETPSENDDGGDGGGGGVGQQQNIRKSSFKWYLTRVSLVGIFEDFIKVSDSSKDLSYKKAAQRLIVYLMRSLNLERKEKQKKQNLEKNIQNNKNCAAHLGGDRISLMMNHSTNTNSSTTTAKTLLLASASSATSDSLFNFSQPTEFSFNEPSRSVTMPSNNSHHNIVKNVEQVGHVATIGKSNNNNEQYKLMNIINANKNLDNDYDGDGEVPSLCNVSELGNSLISLSNAKNAANSFNTTTTANDFDFNDYTKVNPQIVRRCEAICHVLDIFCTLFEPDMPMSLLKTLMNEMDRERMAQKFQKQSLSSLPKSDLIIVQSSPSTPDDESLIVQIRGIQPFISHLMRNEDSALKWSFAFLHQLVNVVLTFKRSYSPYESPLNLIQCVTGQENRKVIELQIWPITGNKYVTNIVFKSIVTFHSKGDTKEHATNSCAAVAVQFLLKLSTVCRKLPPLPVSMLDTSFLSMSLVSSSSASVSASTSAATSFIRTQYEQQPRPSPPPSTQSNDSTYQNVAELNLYEPIPLPPRVEAAAAAAAAAESSSGSGGDIWNEQPNNDKRTQKLPFYVYKNGSTKDAEVKYRLSLKIELLDIFRDVYTPSKTHEELIEEINANSPSEPWITFTTVTKPDYKCRIDSGIQYQVTGLIRNMTNLTATCTEKERAVEDAHRMVIKHLFKCKKLVDTFAELYINAANGAGAKVERFTTSWNVVERLYSLLTAVKCDYNKRAALYAVKVNTQSGLSEFNSESNIENSAKEDVAERLIGYLKKLAKLESLDGPDVARMPLPGTRIPDEALSTYSLPSSFSSSSPSSASRRPSSPCPSVTSITSSLSSSTLAHHDDDGGVNDDPWTASAPRYFPRHSRNAVQSSLNDTLDSILSDSTIITVDNDTKLLQQQQKRTDNNTLSHDVQLHENLEHITKRLNLLITYQKVLTSNNNNEQPKNALKILETFQSLGPPLFSLVTQQDTINSDQPPVYVATLMELNVRIKSHKNLEELAEKFVSFLDKFCKVFSIYKSVRDTYACATDVISEIFMQTNLLRIWQSTSDIRDEIKIEITVQGVGCFAAYGTNVGIARELCARKVVRYLSKWYELMCLRDKEHY